MQKISLYLRMIKFSHSVFSLPFAFTSALIAASGIPSLKQIFWITVAMVGARSGAMGLNRIIDRKIDMDNPRTSGREEISRPGAVIGPKSVPKITFRLLHESLITKEDAYRIHKETPEKVYGIEIQL